MLEPTQVATQEPATNGPVWDTIAALENELLVRKKNGEALIKEEPKAPPTTPRELFDSDPGWRVVVAAAQLVQQADGRSAHDPTTAMAQLTQVLNEDFFGKLPQKRKEPYTSKAIGSALRDSVYGYCADTPKWSAYDEKAEIYAKELRDAEAAVSAAEKAFETARQTMEKATPENRLDLSRAYRAAEQSLEDAQEFRDTTKADLERVKRRALEVREAARAKVRLDAAEDTLTKAKKQVLNLAAKLDAAKLEASEEKVLELEKKCRDVQAEVKAARERLANVRLVREVFGLKPPQGKRSGRKEKKTAATETTQGAHSVEPGSASEVKGAAKTATQAKVEQATQAASTEPKAELKTEAPVAKPATPPTTEVTTKQETTPSAAPQGPAIEKLVVRQRYELGADTFESPKGFVEPALRKMGWEVEREGKGARSKLLLRHPKDPAEHARWAYIEKGYITPTDALAIDPKGPNAVGMKTFFFAVEAGDAAFRLMEHLGVEPVHRKDSRAVPNHRYYGCRTLAQAVTVVDALIAAGIPVGPGQVKPAAS